MYVRGYLQGIENGRVVTIALPQCDEDTESAEVATSVAEQLRLVKSRPRYISALKKVVPDISRPKKSRHYFDALNEREIGR